MYKPQGNFEAVRYGELYGNNPDATKREMRQNGRQFRRYLRSDVADRDRAAFEQAAQQRMNDERAMTDAMLASQLYGSMDRSIQIKPGMTEQDILAQEAMSNAKRQELYMQDVNQRIAGAARFGDAFRAARQAGLQEFTWKGKRYGTQMAGEVTPRTIAPESTIATTPATTPASTPRTTAPASTPSINAGQPLSDAEIAQWAAQQSWSRDDFARLSAEDRQKIAQRRREDSRKRTEDAKAQELASARNVFDNQFQDLVMFKDRGKGIFIYLPLETSKWFPLRYKYYSTVTLTTLPSAISLA
jgi:hypothetical protein